MVAEPKLRRGLDQLSWGIFGTALGLAVTATAVFNSRLGFILLSGLAFCVLAAAWQALVPAVLVAGIFFERAVPSSIVYLGAVIVLIEASRGRVKLLRPPLLLWVGAYVTWAIASVSWTVSLDRTLEGFNSLALDLGALLVFASLIRTHRDLRLVMFAFAFCGLASGLYSIVQFSSGSLARGAGAAFNANAFAFYQVVALPIVVGLATAVRGWRALGLVCVAAVIILSTLMSLSRGGVIALAAVVASMILLPGLSIFRSRSQRIRVGALLLATGTAAFLLVSQPFLARWSNPEDPTGSGRANEWRAAVTAIERNPLTGVGYNGFYAVSNELIRETPGVDLRNFRLTEPGYRVHNAHLGTAAELGVVGGILFAGIFISAWQSLRKAASRGRRSGASSSTVEASALAHGLVGAAVVSIFTSVEVSVMLWSLFGLAVAVPSLVRFGTSSTGAPRPQSVKAGTSS